MDQVFATRAPLFVTRSKGEDIVVMTKSDYESMNETLYLLSNLNPVNPNFHRNPTKSEIKGIKTVELTG